MLAKKYKSELVSLKNPFEGIYTLEFNSLGRPYKYLPGQFLHLALDVDYDGIGQWPDSRCFSMQSNPKEETLKITYAVKGSFTQEMEQLLKVGSEIWLKLPYGNLFQQTHSKMNTVFIAGGTGVTPFLSLFTHESFAAYNNSRIYLGFRSKEFNIYDKELDVMHKNCSSEMNPYVTIHYQDAEGLIDVKKIASENSHASSFFISGPPAMIKGFKSILEEHGVPEQNVLTDDWE